MALQESPHAYVTKSDAPIGLNLGGTFNIPSSARWVVRPFRKVIFVRLGHRKDHPGEYEGGLEAAGIPFLQIVLFRYVHE